MHTTYAHNLELCMRQFVHPSIHTMRTTGDGGSSAASASQHLQHARKEDCRITAWAKCSGYNAAALTRACISPPQAGGGRSPMGPQATGMSRKGAAAPAPAALGSRPEAGGRCSPCAAARTPAGLFLRRLPESSSGPEQTIAGDGARAAMDWRWTREIT